jgi:hypothetical protein
MGSVQVNNDFLRISNVSKQPKSSFWITLTLGFSGCVSCILSKMKKIIFTLKISEMFWGFEVLILEP